MREFRFILSRMIRQKWLVLAALAAVIGQCVLELRIPLLMAEIVDTGVFGENPALITSLGLRMLLICVVLGACGYAASLICAAVGQKLALELRMDLYRKISAFSVLQVSGFGSGSLITRLTTDIDTCSGLVFAMILLVVEPLILMFGGIIMMWRIASALGIFFVVFVVLQLAIMLIFVKHTSAGFMAMRESFDRMNTHLLNAFSNFRLIKAYGTRNGETGSFSETNRDVYEKSYAVQMKLAVFNPIIMMIMNLVIAGILYISGRQVADGAVSVGAVLSAISYAEQVLLSIVAGGGMFRVIAETKPSAARILQVLGTEPDMADGELYFTEKFQELRIENVSFTYPRGAHIFRSLNFCIRAGETVAVVGAIGSGKTTLAGLCARLFDPTSGRVLMNGNDLTSLKIMDVRIAAALVEKQTAVLDGTILENIIFGRENISAEAVSRAVKAAQMTDYVKKTADGLNTMLFSTGKSLSGGEKQRLTAARALAGDPGLLILDDSTSSLDYDTEKKMLEAIRDGYPDMAILLMTNRLPSARRADRIAVLDGGRIADEGTDAELRERCERYRRMVSAQE